MSNNGRNVIQADFGTGRKTGAEVDTKRWIGTPHPAEDVLGWFVGVRWHDFASCYVWEDCAVFNALGDIIGHHRGNTIYLDRETTHDRRDLLHEIGHAVGRHFNRVGHRGNHYVSDWEVRARRLIGAVSNGRHWSGHLNAYAASVDDFGFNAASEIWAELFMLYYLYPDLPEAELIQPEIETLRSDDVFLRLDEDLIRALNRL